MTAIRHYSRGEAGNEAYKISGLVTETKTDHEPAKDLAIQDMSPALREITTRALQMPKFAAIIEKSGKAGLLLAIKPIRQALQEKFPEINDLPRKDPPNDFVIARHLITILKKRRV